ncbi:MAG: phenylacetate--CoA ligase, partial [bacterium]
PGRVEEILFEHEGVTPHYQIRLFRDDSLDKMEILVEVNEQLFFDEMKKQREMVDSIKEDLRGALGINVGVKLVEQESIKRFEGKTRRIVDEREI